MMMGVLVAIASCDADEKEGDGAGAAGGAEGGAGGTAPTFMPDPCEEYTERASCCADVACGWHHGAFEVPPCVDRRRVCEVDGEMVRDCPAGMVCFETGGWKTEDDCAELPPPDTINLKGRGICVWPSSL
jgi:hypothetical protein